MDVQNVVVELVDRHGLSALPVARGRLAEASANADRIAIERWFEICNLLAACIPEADARLTRPRNVN